MWPERVQQDANLRGQFQVLASRDAILHQFSLCRGYGAHLNVPLGHEHGPQHGYEDAHLPAG